MSQAFPFGQAFAYDLGVAYALNSVGLLALIKEIFIGGVYFLLDIEDSARVTGLFGGVIARGVADNEISNALVFSLDAAGS